MTVDNREASPEPDTSTDTGAGTDVPAANPAYATPPSEGIPDADDD